MKIRRLSKLAGLIAPRRRRDSQVRQSLPAQIGGLIPYGLEGLFCRLIP